MRNCFKGMIVFLFFIFNFISLYGQDAAFIESVLEMERLDIGTASQLVLQGAEIIGEDAGAEEYLEYIQKAGWRIRTDQPEKTVTLGDFSLLVMKSFDFSGGIMYTLFPVPRYAAREIAFRGFLRGSPDPTRVLTGNEALQILSAVLNSEGGRI